MQALRENEPVIHPGAQLTEVSFGRYCAVGEGSRVLNSSFGDYSYCERYAEIANAEIGKFANIAAFTRIGATDHPLDTAACHHFLYRSAAYWPGEEEDDAAFFARRRARTARIGHDTWIGHGAMIKPEVTLGHGAVVASGAVVTKDVGPYEIVAGVPAVGLRRRPPPAHADRLIALAWWDWSHEALRQALPDFRTLGAEAFLEKYG